MRDELIEVGSKWQHFKGNIIKVIVIVKHTEDLSTLVVYEHEGSTWARPIEMFLSHEDVSERADNKTGQKYRFIKLGGE